MKYNYCVTWKQGQGYRGNWVNCDGRLTPIGPYHASHVEANLDCLLNHRQVCNIYQPWAAFNLDCVVRPDTKEYE